MSEHYIVTHAKVGSRQFRTLEDANAHAEWLAGWCDRNSEVFIQRVVTESIRAVRGEGGGMTRARTYMDLVTSMGERTPVKVRTYPSENPKLNSRPFYVCGVVTGIAVEEWPKGGGRNWNVTIQTQDGKREIVIEEEL